MCLTVGINCEWPQHTGWLTCPVHILAWVLAMLSEALVVFLRPCRCWFSTFSSVPCMPTIQSFCVVCSVSLTLSLNKIHIKHTLMLRIYYALLVQLSKLKDHQYTQLFREHPAVRSIRIFYIVSCVRFEFVRVVKCSVVLQVMALCSVVGWYHC
jgi:hypothetical protein